MCDQENSIPAPCSFIASTMPFAVCLLSGLCRGISVTNSPDFVLTLVCFAPSKNSNPHCFAIAANSLCEVSAVLTRNFFTRRNGKHYIFFNFQHWKYIQCLRDFEWRNVVRHIRNKFL